MPTKHRKKVTTQYELVYSTKPDYCVLFPMFSVTYIKQHRQNNQDINSWASKSLKCFLIGLYPKSDALMSIIHCPKNS